MKYVRLDVDVSPLLATKKLVVAFPEELVHSIVAEAMVRCVEQHWPGAKVRVAKGGDLHVLDCKTGGKSTSLRLRGDKSDRWLVS